jgi:protein tyrosine phosphatase (PTP) superfamily phosphohydrolase (DUF442 family)
MKLLKTLSTSLFIIALSGGYVTATEPLNNTEVVKKADIKNFAAHSNLVYSAAQPSKEQLKQLSKADVKHVINLRGANEQDWDEGEFVQALGMDYHALPISGAQDITVANARNLASLLKKLNGEPVLVHCASSNRVGALVAISAYEEGLSVDEALEKGRRWGMKSLESKVRDVISK